jgi:putative transposase
VSKRVSPTERIRAQIDALFDGSRGLVEIIEDVARLGAQLIIQTAVEAEVSEFLGRARYQRAAECQDARPGSRNGYRDSTIKTTAGRVTVARPKLRGTTEAFASRLFGAGITKSNALESLVIAGFVRGLSTRDVEATPADALGAEAALSKSTVSTICQGHPRRARSVERPAAGRVHRRLPVPGRVNVQDARWLARQAGARRMGHHQRRQAGVRRPRRRRRREHRCVGRVPRRAQEAWAARPAADHLRRRRRTHRGDRDRVPALAAAEMPHPSERAREGTRRRPRRDPQRPLGDLRRRRPARPRVQAGPKLVAAVQQRIDAFADKYRRAFPSAVKCLLTDREQLTSYLRFPVEHHRRIRHSNFIERTFGETRRRVKVIGRLPGETSCLSLVWAVLDRASRGWRGFAMTPNGLRLLHDLRRQLFDPPTPLRHLDQPSEDQPDSVGAVT